MKKVSKKLLQARKLVDKYRFYTLEEAMELVKKTSYTKFSGSVDLAIRLNLDTRKADQQLRGAVVLPYGTGKNIRVLVATDSAEIATKSLKAGADLIYSTAELEANLKIDNFNFDILVVEPKLMPILGRYGKKLGPKGLMPNPKTGTVSPNPEKAVAEIKKGKANYRADKYGIIHSLIGKTNMEASHLVENAKTLLQLIRRLKPNTVKGNYFKNLTVSASMGPSIKIKYDSF
ncbi:50S ribosomal protein L1 [Mycoplasma flocculare]|uniref:Large ribosomal subunit protein uL1 n=2 Tax=Mesomycoplasma flocculare TaxID=2128 RepID=A0A0A8EC58_MESFC|nr:50S ribosomal protein L1 [Mesomycoplasma flocculare]MXR39405.1 50S ribosomal protein L1 [Mycoplasma sp. MF12]AJC49786.1 50S ribosomal protein L1 [Mesomycoplasma flocculare ATCC 27399]ENX51145.1 50S ribosomal protein L1 [Mesomycoplasma flocculare ATCC 27716]MXR05818.1 50S ribosomal protein L1 [Mesomycoplasma flocculare]MXR12188.1 50S ribosomal protein L1 [Mesomycoplasma flocculare]